MGANMLPVLLYSFGFAAVWSAGNRNPERGLVNNGEKTYSMSRSRVHYIIIHM
jgi:hypothetical protein